MKEALKLALNALEAMQMYAAAEHKGLLIICDEAITAIKEDLAQPAQQDQDSCYCGSEVSLQMVSGGATEEGYLGRVTLLIDGTYVDYVKAQPEQEPVKLWLWKNFVDGKPEYWAFDNAFPIFMDSHDPQTLGEPCGYAWLNPSRAGRTNVSDEQVLQDVQEALAKPEQEPVAWMREDGTLRFAEGKVFAVNQPFYTTPPQRTWGKPWVSLTEEEIQAVAKQARSKDHAVTLTNKLLKEKTMRLL